MSNGLDLFDSLDAAVVPATVPERVAKKPYNARIESYRDADNNWKSNEHMFAALVMDESNRTAMFRIWLSNTMSAFLSLRIEDNVNYSKTIFANGATIEKRLSDREMGMLFIRYYMEVNYSDKYHSIMFNSSSKTVNMNVVTELLALEPDIKAILDREPICPRDDLKFNNRVFGTT